MIQAGKVLRIVPDQAGKGGSKTALTTFETNLDTRKVHNLMIYLGRWRTVPMAQNYGLFTASDALRMLSLHNYLSYDTGDPTMRGTSVILSHVVSASNPIYSEIFNHTKGFTLRASGAYADPKPCTPAVFLNIKNRCFICWGGSNNFIDSDPALTFNDPAKIYDIGVNPPATPPTYELQGGIIFTGDLVDFAVTVTNGSNRVNGVALTPPGTMWPPDTVAVSIYGVTYNVQSPGGYVATFTSGGDASGTSGTNQITIAGFHFPPNGEWNGLLIAITSGGDEGLLILSYVYSGPDTVVTVSTNLANTHTNDTYDIVGYQLILTKPYEGGTVALTATITAFAGEMSWIGSGPQYAYAYYDPVTGHVSNVSPILQITERDQVGQIVMLTNIMPSPTSDQDRFTEILIFRTLLAGGAVLFPISTDFDPTVFEFVPNSGGPQSYTDDNPDANLLVAGGLAAPPPGNNAKPPRFAHMSYWDQRLWGAPVNDPSALVFSGDFIQIPFGVPEESFPSLNQLRIPSDDGRVTGLQLIGGDLVITTERYSYTVQGVGPQYYRLVRLGSAQFGVGDYQMTEFPGDTAETQSGLLYLGRDARFYLMAPGYGNVSVSDPVANQFQEQIINNDTNYQNARVHYFTAPNQRLALVQIGNVQMYDFDRKVWIDTNPNIDTNNIASPEAFCTIYGGDRPVDLIYGNVGTVYSWLRNEPGQQGCVASELSFGAFDFGNKKRKALQFLRIYTNAPSVTFAVYPDETADPYIITAIPEPDPRRSIYAPVADPIEGPDAKELVGFPITNLTEGEMNTATVTFYRLKLNIFPPSDGLQYDYYAIDIGYNELEPLDTTSI